jgi:regulator of protease activity HflC (stomatin/prohibitin superfamily)
LEGAVNGFRVLIFVAVCTGLVLYLYYPNRVLLIVIGEIVVMTLLFFLTMRPVPDPDRAIVYRLATFHHVAGPGYIFLIPTFDRIEGHLDMGPRDLVIEVPQVRTHDKEYVRTNLEVTWHIHPDVRGRVSSKVRSMILRTDEQRAKLVDETVIHMARQVVGSYTLQQLGTPAARETASATMVDGANEILETQGLLVDRIFWRGSTFPGKLSEAKLEGAVRLEHAETLIKMVESIRERLPDMQPEEFLALQAWLDMFQRGGFGPGQPPNPSH